MVVYARRLAAHAGTDSDRGRPGRGDLAEARGLVEVGDAGDHRCTANGRAGRLASVGTADPSVFSCVRGSTECFTATGRSRIFGESGSEGAGFKGGAAVVECGGIWADRGERSVALVPAGGFDADGIAHGGAGGTATPDHGSHAGEDGSLE